MKKILIILSFCYSLAFCGWTYDLTIPKSNDGNGNCYTSDSSSFSDQNIVNSYLYASQAYDKWSWSSSGYWTFEHNHVNVGYNRYNYTISKYYPISVDCSYVLPPICNPDTEVEVNGECEVIGESGTCTAPNIRLGDGSCSTCTTSQSYNISENRCEENCDALSNTYQNSSGGCYDCSSFTELKDIVNCRCQNEITDGSGAFTSDISLVYEEIIDGVKYDFAKPYCDNTPLSIPVYKRDEACDTIDNPLNFLTKGFYYKGVVSREADCSSYIADGKKYTSSYVHEANSNCSSNYDYFCYLMPIDDVNITNADIPPLTDTGKIDITDINNTIPTIPFNPDIDLDDATLATNRALTKIEAELKMQTELEKGIQAWYKDKFGTWQPQTNYQNQLNAQTATTTAVNSLKSPIDNVTGAINNQNSNLGGKLDTINQSINDLNLSVDVAGEVDRLMDFLEGEESDNNGTGYIISDINSSVDFSPIDSFLNNFTTAWDNMQLDIASVGTDGDNLISILQTDLDGGLSLNLPHATVTTCPYTNDLDFTSLKSGWIIPITVDLCVPFSALYPVFYVLFSIMFTAFIIVFGFKSLMRLV